MEIIKKFGWVYYLGIDYKSLCRNKCGKWMYFFTDKKFVANLCKKSIDEDIVVESKHTDGESGVACFYLNGDDFVRHKKILNFFITNNLIRRTKSGKLYNISFKFDRQTRDLEYGNDFNPEIKLENFVDLVTGKWIFNN